MEERGTLLSIGRFAFASGLTVKALRYYAEVGLFRPARIDESSGYRYYDVSQLREAEAIRRLRSLEVPLDEIAAIVGADVETRRARLSVHRARVAASSADKQRILVALGRLIELKEALVSDTQMQIDVRQERELRLAALIRQVHEDDDEFLPRTFKTVATWVRARGGELTFAPLALFRTGDRGGWHLVEAGWPVEPQIESDEYVGVHVYPATRSASHEHQGSYYDLHPIAQRFILECHERGFRFTQPIRIVYLTDIEAEPDPAQWRSRIVWPIE
jgi:DNA-binding transcriptional MerR regulator